MAPDAARRKPILRDRCLRLKPVYNDCYNPELPPATTNGDEYSPYDFGEPLFDDRNVVVARLPTGHIVPGGGKRKMRQWVWKVGYHFTNTNKAANNSIWCCKLCMYFPIQSADF